MNKNILLKCLFCTLILVFSFEYSMACFFGPPYKTVCEVYAKVDSVIIGNVESVESKGSYSKVSIGVKKIFKGKIETQIILDQPSTSCHFDFSEQTGKTLLLFLYYNKKTQTYSMNALSDGMGVSLERNSEDLYWLNSLPASLNRTRISGTISLYQSGTFKFLNNMAGVKLKIFDEQNSYETVTDENGVYEIWDLPPGKYRIKPEIPFGFDMRFSTKGKIESKSMSEINLDEIETIDFKDFKVEIKPQSCGGADYALKKK